ncbi:MAG: hypothetical protein AAGH88_09105 [Planctomycetota bacterium]
MPSILALLDAISEAKITERVTSRFDEARIRFPLQSNLVGDYDAFARLIAAYANHLYQHCVTPGAMLSRGEAESVAKEWLERSLRRGEGNIASLYRDASDGLNGGVLGIIERMTSSAKSQATERYIRHVFDTQVAPHSWADRVEIIRQFISECGSRFGGEIDHRHPERYAHDYTSLVQSYADGLRNTTAKLRGL